ncbi:MAG: archaeal proteasome endopeptidase complex subunit beta [Thermoproteota archaeon]
MIDSNDLASKLVLKGTTTIGLVCKDGVILASDTRVTMGSYVAHKHGKKIYQVADHLAMTISGSVADAQRTVEVLKVNAELYELEIGRPMPVQSAARLISNLLFSSRGVPLVAQVLIGGVDDTGPHVFSLDPFGSLIEENCVATGSGSPIAYGVLEDEYQEDEPYENVLPIIVRSVHSAMKRDSASGDSFDVAVITDEGYQALSEEKKRSLLEDEEA